MQEQAHGQWFLSKIEQEANLAFGTTLRAHKKISRKNIVVVFTHHECWITEENQMLSIQDIPGCLRPRHNKG